MLKKRLSKTIEAGVDEAGRGPLAGSVFAAAVILPANFSDKRLNDSKRMSEKNRYLLRDIIITKAIDWAIGEVSSQRIDEINIFNATFEAMNIAIANLKVRPNKLLIDGPQFNSVSGIDYQCIVGGDGIFASVSAASVLAKTARDDQMRELDKLYPVYDWKNNKGYPTQRHRQAIFDHGITPYHRRSFAGIKEYKFNDQLLMVDEQL